MPSDFHPPILPQLGGDQPPGRADNIQERIIPFPVPARSNGEPEQLPRRRREPHELERPGQARRAGRRRRQGYTPWLQRNALSVAAISVLIALLGLGFGLLQMINRPEAPQASSSTVPADQTAAIVGTTVALPSAASGAGSDAQAVEVRREIRANAKVLGPNYTVVSGDTLNAIAIRFGTTIDRIQAFNNLPDPRALRVGTRLVIPPAL